MSSNTYHRTFLIMKWAATALIFILLSLLYLYSNHQEQLKASQDQSQIGELGPPELRPIFPTQDLLNLADTSIKDDSSPPNFNEDASTLIQLLNTKNLTPKILHIVFWAQWCAPCKSEVPNLQKIASEINKTPQQSIKNQYQIIMVNMDEDLPNQVEGQKFIKLELPSALSFKNQNNNMAQTLNVEAIPFHVLVDKQGRTANMFYQTIESASSVKKIKAQLLQLLAEPNP